VQIPADKRLEDLHTLIQTSFEWKDNYRHRFYIGEGEADRKNLDDKLRIKEACDLGSGEMEYEYGNKWSVKVILLSSHRQDNEEAVRCVAGEGAAPPEIIGGPLRFRKILAALSAGSDMEKQAALHELGPDFVPGLFDIEKCNKKLYSLFSEE
jgi:hypothetical protein